MDKKLIYWQAKARIGKADEVLPELLKVMARNHPNSEIYTTACIVFHALGEFELATGYFNSAGKLDDRNAKLLVAGSLLHTDLHNNEQGLEYLNKAAEISPNIVNTPLYQQCKLRCLKAANNLPMIQDYMMLSW
ncbi:MAG: hypothetical protein ACLFQM_05425 [Fidelibacterota bacterium]